MDPTNEDKPGFLKKDEKQEKPLSFESFTQSEPPPLASPFPPPPPVASSEKEEIKEIPKPIEAVAPAQADQAPVSRFRFPKKIIFILLGVLFLILIIFLLSKVLLKKGPGSQTELTWWGLWEDEGVYKPIITEYETQNPKVKIKYIRNSPKDYRERLTNALAKGTGPDIMRIHNTWVPMFSKELDPVPAKVLPSSEFVARYYQVVATSSSLGNSFAGIPLGYDALTLFINEDIFKSEVVEPPKTWVEVRDLAKKLTKIENDVIVRSGVALGRTENVDHWQDIIGLMLVQNGVNLSKPQGQKAEDVIKFFSIFSSVDGVWNETLPSSTAFFASGKLAMYFAPSWRAANIRDMNQSLNFRTVPLPQVPHETSSDANVSYASFWIDSVWARSKNKDIAWDFLKFISSKESLDSIYQNSAKQRGFGEAYPYVDMAEKLSTHPILGSVVALAPYAQSWYLVSRTFDGTTGINSQISKYFEDAIGAVNKGGEAKKAMETVSTGVNEVLKQYGIVK